MSASGAEREAELRRGDALGDAGSSFELGNLLAQRGGFDQAEAAYRRADDRGHPTAAAYAGLFCEMHGDTAAAEAAYRRADYRGDGFGAFRLGLLLSGRSEWDAAGEAWRRADQRGQVEPPFDRAALLGPGTAAETTGTAGRAGPFTDPVLIGAITVLIAIVAVFLAFSANAGLPFVPTKQLRVDIADGSDLVVGNDVREGGFRIGLVSKMQPVRLGSGVFGAQLTLQLDQSHARVPEDSTVSIRPRSVLGLKYIDLEKGTSATTIPDGGLLTIGHTHVPVQIDDVFNTFDAKTRSAIQQGLVGFGDTLAGRGSALNDTIASLPSLLGHLEPVARYLSDPATGLTRFLNSLNAFMGAIAPVANLQARLFSDAATTFAAISRSASDLENTIAESPSTLQVSTNSLAVQQPFLDHLTTFARNLAPATAELRAALPDINPAIEAGTRTLARTPSLDRKLQGVMVALQNLARSPGTNVALNGLQATVTGLNPLIRYLGPYVTVCNDWNYWWSYLGDVFSETTSFGGAQRALINFGNAAQTNNVGSQGATAPANGGVPNTPLGAPEFAHDPNYGAAVDTHGNADCETGQRGYVLKLNRLDPQGRNFDTDPHTPGNQGPTWTGQLHVPKGQTFSRYPQTGPKPP